MVGPADYQCNSLVSFLRIHTSVCFVLAIVNNSQIQTVSFLQVLFRDIKPHNFVLTPVAHVLIDFGPAEPLLLPSMDGSQSIPKQYIVLFSVELATTSHQRFSFHMKMLC